MKISVIGAGAMGGAIVEGLIKGNYIDNKDICVSDPSRTALELLGGRCVDTNTDATTLRTCVQRGRLALVNEHLSAFSYQL